MNLPTDYEQLQQQYQDLENRYKNLEAIVKMNNLSNLEGLVEQFQVSCRVQLKKIAVEMQVLEHSPQNMKQIIKMIHYLEHVTEEMRKFLN